MFRTIYGPLFEKNGLVHNELNNLLIQMYLAIVITFSHFLVKFQHSWFY